MRIRSDHPLPQFFADLVDRHLVRFVRLEDLEMARYGAGILGEFTHVDQLYRIRNSSGKRLEEVGEMLLEANPLGSGRSFFYEREVRKHIGDYTLFMAGLFPEYLERLRFRTTRLDSVVDYVRAGKESYRIVASFDQFEFRTVAPLFRRLADRFELCVFGLNLMQQELANRQQAWYSNVRQSLLS